MNDGPLNQGTMIDTTDYLEAVGVFRGWKNFFFVIVFVCLLLVQGAFWLVDRGVIDADAEVATAAAASQGDAQPIAEAASAAVADAGLAPGPDRTARFPASLMDDIGFGHVARAVSLANGIAIVSAALYLVAMFFSLMVSMTGRLGGIKHIARAFFLAAIMVLLLVPWQMLFNWRVVGVIYTPAELLHWLAIKDQSTLNMTLYYLRFSGYWAVVMLLVLMAQVRTSRWTKAILRRLEII